MDYEKMRIHELKSLARYRGLRNYSRMRKAELVALLQNNPGDQGPILNKKWIYLNNKKLVSLDHKSRPNLINGTIGQ